jgi:hypothetical protein
MALERQASCLVRAALRLCARAAVCWLWMGSSNQRGNTKQIDDTKQHCKYFM